jgi:hypothetical protein
MALDILLKTHTRLIYILMLPLFFTNCKRDFREVNFYVINKTTRDIEVEYRVRVCLGTQTSCLPRTFEKTLTANEEKKLYFQDNITTDFDIEEGFFYFEISQNGVVSSFNFWKSDKLEKNIEEDLITYRLYVDSEFF